MLNYLANDYFNYRYTVGIHKLFVESSFKTNLKI